MRPHRRVLLRYVLGLFVAQLLLVFAALLAAYLLVDVMDNLQWFTKYESALDEIARFYAARIPLLASRVFPLALLVASALTVSLLAVNGELMAMRACGIPDLRIVGPLLLVCALLAAAYFGVTDRALPHTNAAAQRIKRTEIKEQPAAREAAWVRSGDALHQIEWLDPLRGVARGVVLYRLDAQGLPRSRTDAPEARYVGDGVWRLLDPVRIELGERVRETPARSFVELGDEVTAELEPGHLSVAELRREIRQVEAGGYDATPHRVDLHAKLASPLACLVLPAVALLFAVRGPPFPTPVAMVLFSSLVAVAWALLSAAATSLGARGVLPPAVAGWASVGLLSLWAAALALRVGGLARAR